MHISTLHYDQVCHQQERPPLDEDDIPLSLQSLMTRCWAPNPADRCDLYDILVRYYNYLLPASWS